MNELDYFKALNGRKFRYVGMSTPNIIKVWEYKGMDNGFHNEVLGGLDVRSIDIDTLKSIKAWDDLTPEMQKEITEGLTKETQGVHEQMEKARRGRRKKYENVPSELVCITCGHKQPIQASILIKKVEKISEQKQVPYTIADFLKNFQCQECSPTKRGRQSNPEFSSLPKEMVCKCGNKVATNAYQLKKKADKNKTTIQELISNYVCQECEPTMGRSKNNDLPPKVELVCKCGFKVTYPASVVKKMLEKKGVTLEKFVEGYACQKCSPSHRGRPRKIN